MDSSIPNAAGAGGYVTQLNPNDVLFGRGSGPNDHEGNIRFRDLVGERKAEYMATNHRQTKAKIAREIVGSVMQKNGRFLKKVEPAEASELGIPKGVEAWIAVDDETIMEKAKQALRQQRDKSKSAKDKPSKPDLASPSRKQPAAAPDVVNDSFAKACQYGSGASAEDLHQSHMQNITNEMASYAHGAYLHPNPYEPIPIGSHAVLGPNAALGMDWRQFTQAAILAQTQGHRQQIYTVQPEPTPHHSVSNSQGFSRPLGREKGLQGVDLSDRRESIQVSDLMDSFNKMKTKAFETNHESNDTLGSSKDHESVDTIETIEPLPVGHHPSSMSFSSGNFSSVMKGLLYDSNRVTDSVTTLKGIVEGPVPDPSPLSTGTPKSSFCRSGRRESQRQSIHIDDKDFINVNKSTAGSSDFSNMSMSLSQVWNSKGPTVLGNLNEEDEQREETQRPSTEGPRQVGAMEDDADNMSGLGKSSMSILNVAMGESNCESIMTANDSIFSDIGD